MSVIVCEYTDTECTKVECSIAGCRRERIDPQNTPQPHTEFVLVPREPTVGMQVAGRLYETHPAETYTAMLEAAQPKTLEDVRRDLLNELIAKAETEEAKFFDTDEYQHREHDRDLDMIERFGIGPLYWLRKQLKEGE